MQKTAYEMRISDWSSDVCSSDLAMASGLAWYCNFDGVWPHLPRDAFMAAGAGNRVVIGIPSLNMIIVRNGGNMYDPSKGESYYYGIEHYLVNMLMDALVAPPYPQSEIGRAHG